MSVRTQRYQIARQDRPDSSLADDAGRGVVNGDGGVLDGDFQKAFEDGRGSLQHQAAVPFILVQPDRQCLRVCFEVLVRPAKDNMGARSHA